MFDNEIFFTIILPPIIFSAGYSLRKSLFFENFGMITFLGVIGTIIGFISLCLFCSAIDSLFFNALDLKEIMLVSCVLCATDTVAAMSLIKVTKRLFSPINTLFSMQFYLEKESSMTLLLLFFLEQFPTSLSTKTTALRKNKVI